jgi:hypothetical protein
MLEIERRSREARGEPTMDDPMTLAIAAKRVRDRMDIEIHRTRQGHWHPGHVPCTRTCPMGNPSSRAIFRRELDSAMEPRS